MIVKLIAVFSQSIHLGAFIMYASSLSILSKRFITDKIITRLSPFLHFTLLI